MKLTLSKVLAPVVLALVSIQPLHAAPGDLDPSFSGGDADPGMEIRSISTSTFDSISAIVIQQDGKIVVGGLTFPAGGTYDFLLMRYNPDGTLDPSFGTGGIVTTDFEAATDSISALVIQEDGKIVAAGQSNQRFALARYNPDGSLDTAVDKSPGSFSDDGKVITDFPESTASGESILDLVIQPDGKIIAVGYIQITVGGSTSYDFALARYRTNSSASGFSDADLLDPDFSGDGRVIQDVSGPVTADLAFATAIQNLPDGSFRILAAGPSNNSVNFALVRFDATGSLDTSFDSDGVVTTTFGPELALARAMAINPVDQTILVAGCYGPSAVYDFALARYNPDGSLDTNFDPSDHDGKVVTDFTPPGAVSVSDCAHAVAIQPDRKILAAGISGADLAVARYNYDGGLDTTWDGDGRLTTDLGGSNDLLFAIALQPDSRIAVAGRKWSSGSATGPLAILRYLNYTADLSVTGSVSPDPATAGSPLTYSMTVTNSAGSETASSVRLVDDLPGAATFVSASSSQGTCSGTDTVTCDLGPMVGGSSATVTITVTPTSEGTLDHNALASLSGFIFEPDTSNNLLDLTTIVNLAPTLTTGGGPTGGQTISDDQVQQVFDTPSISGPASPEQIFDAPPISTGEGTSSDSTAPASARGSGCSLLL